MPEIQNDTGSASDLRELVAGVASAYFSTTHVLPADIPVVIANIATSLRAVTGAPEAEAAAQAAPAKRATPAEIRRSITPDALISFEDGRPYKTLRRHLRARGLSPEQYREKWGLPRDYPMTAASYSAARSGLAKQMGLAERGVKARRRTRRG